jgi:phosphoserine phosphatase RsbU/P
LRDRLYLVGFLLIAAVLLFVGRNQLPSSTLLTWGLTFGATTAVGVLLVSLYRVQLELKASRTELARKQAELQFAREVQAALFPHRLPVGRGLSFAAVCVPAQGISGDFYDIVECPDRRLVVALADISGKGVSAAILMSNMQARFRALVEEIDDLAEVCTRLNQHLYEFTDPERFATFFVMQWRGGSCCAEFVNAGHQVPLLIGSTQHRFEKGGPPLGLFRSIEYESGRVELSQGDLLVLYSDGIVEAAGPNEEEFGVARLTEGVKQRLGGSLGEIQQGILEDVIRWSAREPEDDMTVVVIRVDGRGGRLDAGPARAESRHAVGSDVPAGIGEVQ